MPSAFTKKINTPLTNIYGKRLSMLELALIFLFPLFHMSFYRYIVVPEIVQRLFLYIAIIGSLVYCFKEISFSNYKFNTIPFYVKGILIAVVMSSIVAMVSRGQNLIDSYKEYMPSFLGYVYFFILHKIKPAYFVIIKLIFIYALLYLLCYFLGIINAPKIVFVSFIDEINDDRGFFRLAIRGLNFVVILFFYSIAKAVKNWRWYILVGVTYTLILLSLTRQYIVFSLFVAGLFLVWKKVWLRLIVVSIALFTLTLQNINVQVDDSTIVGALVNMTITQVDNQGYDDIRVEAFDAFISGFHQSFLEIFFGCGLSALGSTYDQWEEHHFVNNGYYRSDIGYAGIYVTFGLLGLFIYLSLFYKIVKMSNLGDLVFAKLFVLFVILVNIASWPVSSSVSEICICLYILTVLRTEQKVFANKK